uniref:glutathione transferase n=1 Tax=Unio tumidus TaxID=143298 RepID=Q5BTY5_9BIVA|nr:glutathione S-transferase pi-class [Unio tumidus]
MKAYKLVYFPIRGRIEPVRLLLVDNDLPYEDVNCSDGWPDSWKPKLAFGQVLQLIDGDFELVQSNTMLRYLGRKHDLYGGDVKEGAHIDMINDGVEDYRLAYVKLIYQNYDAGKQEFIAGLPAKFQYLEKLLKASSGAIVKGKKTYADYNLFDLLDIHLLLAPSCLDSFPTLKAFHDEIANRPNIKKYRSTDAWKKLPVNGNGKQ